MTVRQRIHPVAGSVGAVVLLAGCWNAQSPPDDRDSSAPEVGSYDSVSPEAAPEFFGRCTIPGERELSGAGVHTLPFVEVVSWPAMTSPPEATEEVELTLAEMPAGKSVPWTGHVPSDQVEAWQWAKVHQARIFAVPAEDENQIYLSVVIPRVGLPFVPGECNYPVNTKPLMDELGSEYAETVTRWVADGDPSTWDALHEQSSQTPVSAGPTYLYPGEAPEGVLDTLTNVGFEVSYPSAWQGRGLAIISKSPQGWNDGFSLERANETPPWPNAYIGTDGDLEWWLLADEDPEKPLALLGRISMREPQEALKMTEARIQIRIEGPADLQQVIDGRASTEVGLR